MRAARAHTHADQPELEQLPAAWRARANDLRRFAAAESAAVAWEQAAADLEHTLRTAAAELLTIEAAATESGYSSDHLARLVRTGELPNAGRKHAPRIRRADLPRKPGTLPPSPALRMVATREEIARAVVHSDQERHDG